MAAVGGKFFLDNMKQSCFSEFLTLSGKFQRTLSACRGHTYNPSTDLSAKWAKQGFYLNTVFSTHTLLSIQLSTSSSPSVYPSSHLFFTSRFPLLFNPVHFSHIISAVGLLFLYVHPPFHLHLFSTSSITLHH